MTKKNSHGGARRGAGRKPKPAPPGTTRIRFDRSYPLPCSIRSDTPSGICGKDAYVAYAWVPAPSGMWATPGLWTVQPVCAECAAAAAKVYEK